MANAFPVETNHKQLLSTGFIIGLQLSINTDNTKVDIAAGTYIVTDYTDPEYPNPRIIHFDGLTGLTPQYLNTNTASYIALDRDGNVVQSSNRFTPEQRRDYCTIGAAIHSNQLNVNVVNEIKNPIVGDIEQLHDLMSVIGALNIEGNEYSETGTGLTIDKTGGTIFKLGVEPQNYKAPHTLFLPPIVATSFRYRLQDGTEYAERTTINPTQYDLNGVLTTVPNQKWTIQHINLFQSNQTRIQYGQIVYDKFDDALVHVQTDPFIIEKNIADNAIFRCYLVIKKEVTNLQAAIAANEARFILTDKFGSVIGGAGVALTYAAIVSALGYVPEDQGNKAIDFNTINNIRYPSVQAVVDYIDALDFSQNTIVRTIQISEYSLTTNDQAGVQEYILQQGIVISKDEIILIKVDKISSYMISGYVEEGYVF